MGTILVMDDDPVVRTTLVRALEAFSYDAVAFEDALPALEQADFSKVDLVITDLKMPTPGDEAIRMLKERGIDVPVLVMTGNLDLEKAESLRALGVETILEKPFPLSDMMAMVENLLEGPSH